MTAFQTKVRFPIIFVLLLIVNQLFGQLEVTKVSNNFLNEDLDGFLYSLPRTGIKVDITVKKTQKIKGPYSEFADKYLGLSQVITLNSTEYEISSIQLSTFIEPDPSEYYFVRNTGKKKDRVPLEFFLSNKGVLVGMYVNSDFDDKGNKNKEMETSMFGISEKPNPTMFERVDTVIRKISVDTTTIEQKVFKRTSAAKTMDQKAKEAADFVLKLEESMFNLINGYQEVNYEKGTMEFMYHQMDQLKGEYLELFKGVTGVSQELYSYTYFPEKNNENAPVTLCKFSMSKGILEKYAAAGDLVQLEVKGLDEIKEIKEFTDKRNNQNESKRGVYYRIPDEAIVSVKVGGQKQIESKFLLNQLGVVTFLPSSSFGMLEFYDNTGGLKHVIIR
jgi:hypothetical protein